MIAYATDLKAALLGVSAALLAERGAVDPDVAGAMAAGWRGGWGRDRGGDHRGGGPDAADGKPPGTVHIAVCARRQARWSRRWPFPAAGTRSGAGTVERSLRLLWSVLWEESP